jgi:hypothetical protein
MFVFNQYYIDFIKRIKSVAKKHKENSSTAKKILKDIKNNYTTLDKTTDEYLIFLNANISEESWVNYNKESNEDDEEWFKENAELYLYENIKIGEIKKLLKDDYLCSHFISVFYIFRKDISEQLGFKIINSLQSFDISELETDDEEIKRAILKLQNIRNKKIKETSGIDMKGIEDTMLGKLAKEIIQDIDVEKLKKSMGDEGDVLKAIGDPDSGFSDIVTNVSKKMATKISNGDFKQENLIQDALKFASIMPNMFGGGANKSGGADGSSGEPDMANMMNMMASMMGGMGGNKNGNNDFKDIMKNMANVASSGKKKANSRTVVNEGLLKKMANMKKLKHKMQERKKLSSGKVDNE